MTDWTSSAAFCRFVWVSKLRHSGVKARSYSPTSSGSWLRHRRRRWCSSFRRFSSPDGPYSAYVVHNRRTVWLRQAFMNADYGYERNLADEAEHSAVAADTSLTPGTLLCATIR